MAEDISYDSGWDLPTLAEIHGEDEEEHEMLVEAGEDNKTKKKETESEEDVRKALYW